MRSRGSQDKGHEIKGGRFDVGDIIVQELMVPLEEYATVSEDATIYEAVLALEKAQATFDPARYRHRAILVYNVNGDVVGKLSLIDVMRALEPSFLKTLETVPMSRFGISETLVDMALRRLHFWNRPLIELCVNAGKRKVRDYMYRPTKKEFINEDATLPMALHRLVMGQRHSLLVTQKERIVGVLRLTDVFTAVSQTMKSAFASEEV